MAPYPPQDSGVQLQQRKKLLIVGKKPRAGAVNIRQKTGELLSDGDCHNSTKEKLQLQEKPKLSCSSGSRPNNGPDDSGSTSVTSPIAMRYWNYCTNRTDGDQPRGRVQWKVSSIHSDSMITRPEAAVPQAGPERSIYRQTDRSESVPRTIRRMKITARVESPSPSPMSRTPGSPSPPHQNMSLLNLPDSSIIPKKLTDYNNNNNNNDNNNNNNNNNNDDDDDDESCRDIVSPPKSPTRMTNIFKNGSTKDRIEGVTSPTPWNQKKHSGADCIERVKSPTEKDSQPGGTTAAAPAIIPFRRIQSPLPFLVKSPNSLSPTNGSAVSLGEGKSVENKTNSHLAGSHVVNEADTRASICDQFGFVCDEKQEGKISGPPEIKMKPLTQEDINNLTMKLFSRASDDVKLSLLLDSLPKLNVKKILADMSESEKEVTKGRLRAMTQNLVVQKRRDQN